MCDDQVLTDLIRMQVAVRQLPEFIPNVIYKRSSKVYFLKHRPGKRVYWPQDSPAALGFPSQDPLK